MLGIRRYISNPKFFDGANSLATCDGINGGAKRVKKRHITCHGGKPWFFRGFLMSTVKNEKLHDFPFPFELAKCDFIFPKKRKMHQYLPTMKKKFGLEVPMLTKSDFQFTNDSYPSSKYTYPVDRIDNPFLSKNKNENITKCFNQWELHEVVEWIESIGLEKHKNFLIQNVNTLESIQIDKLKDAGFLDHECVLFFLARKKLNFLPSQDKKGLASAFKSSIQYPSFKSPMPSLTQEKLDFLLTGSVSINRSILDDLRGCSRSGNINFEIMDFFRSNFLTREQILATLQNFDPLEKVEMIELPPLQPEEHDAFSGPGIINTWVQEKNVDRLKHLASVVQENDGEESGNTENLVVALIKLDLLEEAYELILRSFVLGIKLSNYVYVWFIDGLMQRGNFYFAMEFYLILSKVNVQFSSELYEKGLCVTGQLQTSDLMLKILEDCWDSDLRLYSKLELTCVSMKFAAKICSSELMNSIFDLCKSLNSKNLKTSSGFEVNADVQKTSKLCYYIFSDLIGDTIAQIHDRSILDIGQSYIINLLGNCGQIDCAYEIVVHLALKGELGQHSLLAWIDCKLLDSDSGEQILSQLNLFTAMGVELKSTILDHLMLRCSNMNVLSTLWTWFITCPNFVPTIRSILTFMECLTSRFFCELNVLIDLDCILDTANIPAYIRFLYYHNLFCKILEYPLSEKVEKTVKTIKANWEGDFGSNKWLEVWPIMKWYIKEINDFAKTSKFGCEFRGLMAQMILRKKVLTQKELQNVFLWEETDGVQNTGTIKEDGVV